MNYLALSLLGLYLLLALGYLLFAFKQQASLLLYLRRFFYLVLIPHFMLCGWILNKNFVWQAFTLSHILVYCSSLMALTYLFLDRGQKLKGFGLFVFPWLSFLFFLIWKNSYLLGVNHELISQSTLYFDSLAALHLLLVFLSLSILFLAFIVALLFTFQDYQIKNHRFTRIFTCLPALQSMSRMHLYMLRFGFVLLTFAILSGAIWSRHTRGIYFSLDFKQASALAAWFFYGLFLCFRSSSKLQGRKGMLLSALGFAVIALSLAGVH